MAVLVALPDQAEPVQRARLLTALSVGSEIIHLRHMAPRLGVAEELDAALEAFAQGNSAISIARLRQLDRRLTSGPDTAPQTADRDSGARPHPGHVRGAIRPCFLFRRRSDRMSLAEVNLFGVYVAPISLIMVASWLVTIVLRRIADRSGLLRYVWHPALFTFAIYIIVLSSWILIVAR